MTKKQADNLKQGDAIYKVTDIGVIPCIVKSVDNSGYYTRIYFNIGNSANRAEISPSFKGNKTYYLTKEEAEKFLKEQETNKTKKKKLYEYELKLNEELGCNTFLIKY